MEPTLDETPSEPSGFNWLNAGKSALDAAGYIASLPTAGVDYLARKSARAMGVPVSDETTVGQMLRAGVGLEPGAETSLQGSPYAQKLVGGAVEFAGGLLDPTLPLSFGVGGAIQKGLTARAALKSGFLVPEAAAAAAKAATAARRAELAGRGAGALMAGTMARGAVQEGLGAAEAYQREGFTPEVAEQSLRALLGAGGTALIGHEAFQRTPKLTSGVDLEPGVVPGTQPGLPGATGTAYWQPDLQAPLEGLPDYRPSGPVTQTLRPRIPQPAAPLGTGTPYAPQAMLAPEAIPAGYPEMGRIAAMAPEAPVVQRTGTGQASLLEPMAFPEQPGVTAEGPTGTPMAFNVPERVPEPAVIPEAAAVPEAAPLSPIRQADAAELAKITPNLAAMEFGDLRKALKEYNQYLLRDSAEAVRQELLRRKTPEGRAAVSEPVTTLRGQIPEPGNVKPATIFTRGKPRPASDLTLENAARIPGQIEALQEARLGEAPLEELPLLTREAQARIKAARPEAPAAEAPIELEPGEVPIPAEKPQRGKKLPALPMDELGSPIIPGHEDWAPEHRAAVRSAAYQYALEAPKWATEHSPERSGSAWKDHQRARQGQGQFLGAARSGSCGSEQAGSGLGRAVEGGSAPWRGSCARRGCESPAEAQAAGAEGTPIFDGEAAAARLLAGARTPQPRGMSAGAEQGISAIKDVATYGASLIEKGIRDFAAWSQEMTARLGEALPSLGKYLKAIYDRSVKMAKDAGAWLGERVGDERGALGEFPERSTQDLVESFKVSEPTTVPKRAKPTASGVEGVEAAMPEPESALEGLVQGRRKLLAERKASGFDFPLKKLPEHLQERAKEVAERIGDFLYEKKRGRLDDDLLQEFLKREPDLQPHATAIGKHAELDAEALTGGHSYLNGLREKYPNEGPDGLQIIDYDTGLPVDWRTQEIPPSYDIIQRYNNRIEGAASVRGGGLAMIAGGRRRMKSPVSIGPVYKLLDNFGAEPNNLLSLHGAETVDTSAAKRVAEEAGNVRGEELPSGPGGARTEPGEDRGVETALRQLGAEHPRVAPEGRGQKGKVDASLAGVSGRAVGGREAGAGSRAEGSAAGTTGEPITPAEGAPAQRAGQAEVAHAARRAEQAGVELSEPRRQAGGLHRQPGPDVTPGALEAGEGIPRDLRRGGGEGEVAPPVLPERGQPKYSTKQDPLGFFSQLGKVVEKLPDHEGLGHA